MIAGVRSPETTVTSITCIYCHTQGFPGCCAGRFQIVCNSCRSPLVFDNDYWARRRSKESPTAFRKVRRVALTEPLGSQKCTPCQNVMAVDQEVVMRLSRTIVYAIHASLQLADAPVGVAISRGQLASEGQLPERFLLEILHSLVARGLVRSVRGVEGGFSLAKPTDQITCATYSKRSIFPVNPSSRGRRSAPCNSRTADNGPGPGLHRRLGRTRKVDARRIAPSG